MTETPEKKKCTICRKKRICQPVGLSHCCDSKECFDELIKKAKLRGQRRLAALRKKQEKQDRQKRAHKKEADTSLEKLCVRTQKVVNSYLRAVDTYEGYSCISCRGPIEHAGHLHHSGSKWKISRFRFSHIIIHGQCLQCNNYTGGGNADAYRNGLKLRYGPDYLEKIAELKLRAERGELALISRDELREMRTWHSAQTKIIQNAIQTGEKIENYYGRIIDQW